MQYVREELFHFLEQSPYFYEKMKIAAKHKCDDSLEKKTEEITHVEYTFFDQESPNQIIAKITIPVRNPYEEIKWSFIQMNEEVSKPIFQSINPGINAMPLWFRCLILETREMYDRIITIFKIFSPIEKN